MPAPDSRVAPPPRSAKNREIEALRALAIVLTLFQHLPILLPWPDPPAWLKLVYDRLAFWGGVDLFFVISGFVVTQSLLNAFAAAADRRGSRWTEVKRFWVRRAFRLLPLAWLWVAIVLIATRFFNDSAVFGGLPENARQALWILLYVYNWFVYSLSAAGVNIAPLGVYWSLAVEEQFYLLLPLLLLALKPRVLLVALALAIVAQFFLWRPAPWIEPFWGLRVDALVWGVLLAFFTRRPAHAATRPAWLEPAALRWLANGLLIVAIVGMPAALMRVSFSTGLLAMVCTIYVWLASHERGFVLPAGRLTVLFDWLGARSYAIYVIHVTAFMLIREVTFRLARAGGVTQDWNWAAGCLAAGIALTFLAAEFCHRLIEQPLRRYGRQISNKVI